MTEQAAETPTTIDFLYLSEPDMIAAGVTDMAACIDTLDEMFGLLYAGDYRMAGPNNDSHGAMVEFPEHSPFATMPKPTADRRFMAMPAYLGGSFQTAGVKWYGSNIENKRKGLPRSILMFTLSDVETGAPLAYMSANLLSAYRTGAVPGVAARRLARPDARIVGILGPGVMARTSLAAFISACPDIDTVKVKGRSRGSIEGFTDWVAQHYPDVQVIEVDSEEAVVRDSDIVTYCTSAETGDISTYPRLRREWVKPGAFISLPAAADIDEGLQRSDVLKVVDNIGLYDAWAEETPKPTHKYIPIIGCKFIDMIESGTMQRDELVDLGAIVTGDASGRTSDDQIVIFSVGGMPVEDVAWGTVLYRRALEQGIGQRLNLWAEPALH